MQEIPAILFPGKSAGWGVFASTIHTGTMKTWLAGLALTVGA